MQIRQIEALIADCPFCKDGLEGEVWTCPGCPTSYHSDCWSEHGGCVLLGCYAPQQRPVHAPRGIPAWRRARLAEQAAQDRSEAERRRVAAAAEVLLRPEPRRLTKAASIQGEEVALMGIGRDGPPVEPLSSFLERMAPLVFVLMTLALLLLAS
jgi:RING finger family protein